MKYYTPISNIELIVFQINIYIQLIMFQLHITLLNLNRMVLKLSETKLFEIFINSLEFDVS
ncbi:unnamed protein product, partial [marine sediment metagenome]